MSANDLGSDEVFERYLSETAAGTSAADLLVTNATSAWASFAARGDVLAEYEPSQLAGLPEFATLLPNVFAMSMDPVTIGYNSSLLPEGQRPTDIRVLRRSSVPPRTSSTT